MQFLIALVLAAAPQWHEHIHADADHDDHECLVTHVMDGDLGNGGGLPPPVEAAEPPRVVPCETVSIPWDGPWVSPLCLDDGLLVHGPPRLG